MSFPIVNTWDCFLKCVKIHQICFLISSFDLKSQWRTGVRFSWFTRWIAEVICRWTGVLAQDSLQTVCQHSNILYLLYFLWNEAQALHISAWLCLHHILLIEAHSANKINVLWFSAFSLEDFMVHFPTLKSTFHLAELKQFNNYLKNNFCPLQLEPIQPC